MSELAVNYQGVDFDSLRRDSPEFQRVHGVVLGIGGKEKRVKVR